MSALLQPPETNQGISAGTMSYGVVKSAYIQTLEQVVDKTSRGVDLEVAFVGRGRECVM